MHKKDRPLLEQIQIFFKGVGEITDGIDDLVQYNVSAIADIIQVVIPHFEKYPLLTQNTLILDYLNLLQN